MPDAWTTSRLRNIAEIRVSNVDKKTYSSETPVKLCNYMDVYENEYITSELDFMSASASEAEIDRFSLHAGDVVITKDSETPDDIGVPAVIVEPIENLVCGYHLAMIRAKRNSIHPIYLAKQLASTVAARYFSVHASGSTRFGLPIGAIENLDLPLPPIPEQSKIAEVLSTVDRAIEQTETLIAKQQRIKTGLMQDLLTRGIDENGNLRSEQTHQFKDSPLGRIPVEWATSPIGKQIAFITDYRGKTPPYVSDGIPVISAETIGDDRVQAITKYVTDETYKRWTTRGFPEPDDVIFTTEAPVGEIAFIPADRTYLLTRRVIALRPDTTVLRKAFLFWNLLQAKKTEYWERLTAGTTVPRIRKPDILGLQIPMPAPEEQDQIGIILQRQQALAQTAIRSKMKLQALKAGLMQDLLTGKVRVTPLIEKEEKAVTA